MPKLNLTDEEKLKLLEAVNAGVELTPDFLPKLFPGVAEKFDVKALDRAKIPTLEYAGKRSKAAILAEAGAGIGAAPLQVVRSFGEVKEGEWQNLIVQGDNLQFLKTCYRNEDPLIKDKVKGKVKLIYIDPPFSTESDFSTSDGVKSYSDQIARSEFIEALRTRLILLEPLLADEGSFYIHLDQKMVHYSRVILDEVFGVASFSGHITWYYPNKIPDARKKIFTVSSDHILIYAKKQGRQTFNPQYLDVSPHKRAKEVKIDGIKQSVRDEEGRVVYGMYDKRLMDNVWNIPSLAGSSYEKSNIDYPTQKPERLLNLIISAATDEGDLVIDLFAGSGTTAAVAEKLGRRWITCDFGKHAIYTMQRRLLRIGESKALVEEKDATGEVVVKKGESYGHAPKPFAVISAGAYDFSHVMALGKPEHKDAYVAFVLGLFQLVRDEEKAKRYKLTNIYAEKDGHPVEVYPVWDEHFLKEVRIDETYLKGIITQAGGRLKGEYYIITPESCTNIGETKIKNAEGKGVVFKFLTFPYKVLEDASRHLELHEQPASQGAVNELITSTAFYFNEDVEIALMRKGDGLKLTKFETKILDKDGNRFPGHTGLAMLLMDLDYEVGKPFDMDKTVFAKEVAEDGSFVVAGISKSVAVIAIDKHGNESKPYIVK